MNEVGLTSSVGSLWAGSGRARSEVAVGDGPFAERFERAREAASEMVSSAFVEPVLAQLRDSSMAEAPFGPGMWERRFGPVVDGLVARELVSGGGWGLVDVMAERFVGLARATEHGRARVALKSAGS